MNFFHLHDHELLQKIFFPKEIANDEFILFCTGGDCSGDIDLSDVSGVIGMGKTRCLPGFKSRQFHFVKNPDGSIRWLIPSECRKPVFLKLYNGSGWRGRAFRSFFQLTYRANLKHLSKLGTLQVFYKKEELFDGLLDNFHPTEFAIFTGTVGENRKAVFSLIDKKGKDWFFKFPLTDSSRKLVKREAAALRELDGLVFKNLEIPKVKPFGKGILVSSVKPLSSKNNHSLQSAHFQSLAELSNMTKLEISLSSLAAWEEIKTNLEILKSAEIKNDLPSATIEKIRKGLQWIYFSFDPSEIFPTTVSHGDFTPWNMYVSKGKAHVYDWEMSGRKPLLYDAFHFVFQSGILIGHADFESISNQVFDLKKSINNIDSLSMNDEVFERLYHFYLLHNVSYYLARYMDQSPLHEQAHWLVDVWEKAISKVVASMPSQPESKTSAGFQTLPTFSMA